MSLRVCGRLQQEGGQGAGLPRHRVGLVRGSRLEHAAGDAEQQGPILGRRKAVLPRSVIDPVDHLGELPGVPRAPRDLGGEVLHAAGSGVRVLGKVDQPRTQFLGGRRARGLREVELQPQEGTFGSGGAAIGLDEFFGGF